MAPTPPRENLATDGVQAASVLARVATPVTSTRTTAFSSSVTRRPRERLCRRPSEKAWNVVPPSRLSKTPPSVPTRSRFGFLWDHATALVSSNGPSRRQCGSLSKSRANAPLSVAIAAKVGLWGDMTTCWDTYRVPKQLKWRQLRPPSDVAKTPSSLVPATTTAGFPGAIAIEFVIGSAPVVHDRPPSSERWTFPPSKGWSLHSILSG